MAGSEPMQARVELLDGVFDLTTSLGGGIVVQINVPLTGEQNDEPLNSRQST